MSHVSRHSKLVPHPLAIRTSHGTPSWCHIFRPFSSHSAGAASIIHLLPQFFFYNCSNSSPLRGQVTCISLSAPITCIKVNRARDGSSAMLLWDGTLANQNMDSTLDSFSSHDSSNFLKSGDPEVPLIKASSEDWLSMKYITRRDFMDSPHKLEETTTA